jgi:predicted dehydrogenase
MNKLRMAVIGVGALGRHHARILAGFDDVELVGVVDSRPEQGQQVAAQSGTRWFSDPDQIVGLVDAVVVAVPTICHHDVASPFLNAGIPVLMEKPLAASLAESQRLHRLASFRGTTLQVGHVERFNPAFQELAARCGNPLYIRCQRVSPYTFRSTDIGVVHDLMIHDIDLVLALVGGSVESVDSFGAVTMGPHEDMAVARLRTSTGVIADLTASRMNPTAERSLQVWCDNGYLQADLQSRKVTTWKPAPLFVADPSLVHAIAAATPNPLSLKDEVFGKWLQHEEIQASSADALTAELRDFTGSVREGRRPLVTSEDAVQAMQIADSVLSAMQRWSFQTGSGSVALPKAA